MREPDTTAHEGDQIPAPRDFGSIFALSRSALPNDDLGLLHEIAQKLAGKHDHSNMEKKNA